MTFLSAQFAVFILIVFTLYWALPAGRRPALLLTASWAFYAFAGLPYLLLLCYITVLSWFAGGILTERRDQAYSPALYLFSALLFLPLILYKALGFLDGGIAVPVGLSFYSFQAVAFLSDISRGRAERDPSLKNHALFLSFFPQLLAGPIPRAADLLPQLENLPAFSEEKARRGVLRFLWGAFKKAALADTLAANADIVFRHPDAYHGFALILAAVLYSLQIYCDFSAYSDMAIGIASLFGITLRENFRFPYFATSVKAFWERWHISLSTWLRDYIYIPLGGSRKGRLRSDVNLVITFLVSGLWHGTGPTFLIWGLLHAAFLLIERHLPHRSSPERTHRSRIPRMLSAAAHLTLTFLAVTAAWIFFRARDPRDAFVFFAHGLDGISHPVSYIADGLRVFRDKKALILMLAMLLCYELASVRCDMLTRMDRLHPALRRMCVVVFLLLTWWLLPIRADHPFIYFAF